MKTRKEITHLIQEKIEKIKAIRAEIIELKKENLLLCDEEQWFTEQEETFGRGKKKHTHLIGRINFIQEFEDVSTGEKIPIERTEIVRVDGVWQLN